MNFAHVANDGSEMSFVIKQQVAWTTDWQKSKAFEHWTPVFSHLPQTKETIFPDTNANPRFLQQEDLPAFAHIEVQSWHIMTSVPAYAAWRWKQWSWVEAWFCHALASRFCDSSLVTASPLQRQALVVALQRLRRLSKRYNVLQLCGKYVSDSFWSDDLDVGVLSYLEPWRDAGEMRDEHMRPACWKGSTVLAQMSRSMRPADTIRCHGFGDGSKSIITIFGGNRHPLTSHYRVPMGTRVLTAIWTPVVCCNLEGCPHVERDWRRDQYPGGRCGCLCCKVGTIGGMACNHMQTVLVCVCVII